MSSAPFIDARKWEAPERRTALIRIDGEAIMFTASWSRPSSLVPRPDGSYRRLLLVCLQVPSEHRERCFHRVQFATMYGSGEAGFFSTDDIAGVHTRDLYSVTIALYVDHGH
jgi:hypothetical protein